MGGKVLAGECVRVVVSIYDIYLPPVICFRALGYGFARWLYLRPRKGEMRSPSGVRLEGEIGAGPGARGWEAGNEDTTLGPRVSGSAPNQRMGTTGELEEIELAGAPEGLLAAMCVKFAVEVLEMGL